jgi:putative restriction endonuclease
MTRLTKPELLERVEEGFRSGGWDLLYLSEQGAHPARYRIRRDDSVLTVRVYIWNISHGGGPRSAAEFRIQITGLATNQFVPEIGGKTLILGWWDDDEVFAGFDYRRHSGPLGGSPSLQIGLPALQAAVANGFAVHPKNNGELAIAFRPDFIGTYAENLESLHDTGEVQGEIDLLTRIAAGPEIVADAEIETGVAAPRQRAVIQTMRALRALDFRQRILDAYNNRCAVCEMQLRLLDAAHILPVAEPDSTDETANGVALCALHHRAYDRALITFDSEYRVHLNDENVTGLKAAGLDGKLSAFSDALPEVISVPEEVTHRPRAVFVEKANALRGWRL